MGTTTVWEQECDLISDIIYSKVPNKRISLIREYHEYFLIVVNEYHVINEYLGKSHDIHKRIWPNKWISRKTLWYS